MAPESDEGLQRAQAQRGPAEKLTLKLRSISLSDSAQQPPHGPQALRTALMNAHQASVVTIITEDGMTIKVTAPSTFLDYEVLLPRLPYHFKCYCLIVHRLQGPLGD